MKKEIYVFIFIVLILTLSINSTTAAERFNSAEADFSLIYNQLEIPFQKFSIFVMPGEQIELAIAKKNRNREYLIKIGDKNFVSSKTFKWQAPKKSGYYPVIIKAKNSNHSASKIKLNVFVLYPFEKKKGEYLDGFRIGNYPKIPTAKRDYYSRPKGFLKIDKSLLEINLSPHFKMKQFLTNQTKSLPHYIVIKETLLLKLEYFLKEVNQKGYDAETFGIVSLYRTPYLNKKLGNNTSLSRHLFGDAADIYIDNSGDNWMDDLNKDGKSSILDANILFDLALEFDQQKILPELQGGLGSYRGNGVRGPFIHIDARGFHVSW